jgi:hypothetical protein
MVSFRDLLVRARQEDCTLPFFPASAQEAREASLLIGDENVGQIGSQFSSSKGQTKYYLKRDRMYSRLPLTERQAMLVNLALSRGKDPGRYLSPTQIDMLGFLRGRTRRIPVYDGADLVDQWDLIAGLMGAR